MKVNVKCARCNTIKVTDTTNSPKWLELYMEDDITLDFCSFKCVGEWCTEHANQPEQQTQEGGYNCL